MKHLAIGIVSERARSGLDHFVAQAVKSSLAQTGTDFAISPTDDAVVNDEAASERTRPALEAACTAVIDPGAVAGSGTEECPADYPIKGNAQSGIYHVPGGGSYHQTIPEFCFATADAAEEAGFRAAKH